MRRLRQLHRDERGFALVLALGIVVVLSMTVVTVIESTTANQRTSVQSKNRVSTFSLAEAGINNAASILTNNNAYDSHVLHPQNPVPADCANPTPVPASAPSLGNTCSPYTFTYDGGTASVWGQYDSTSETWTVTSTGQVRNPFGGQATTRTLVATIHIRATPSQNNYVTAWNYVFVKDTTSGVCNVTLDQSSDLNVSLYIAGNLCFKNTAGISESDSTNPVTLEVLGRLAWLNGSSHGIGNTGLPNNGAISSAKIGLGCSSGITGTLHTCSSSTDYFYVKSGGYSQTAPPITAPTLSNSDFSNYYTSAYISKGNLGSDGVVCDNPGPDASTRLADSNFDNNTTPLDGTGGNGSAGTFNLTPGNTYTCEVKDANGAVVGELSWDNTNKILKVRGTVFIDGNLSITQSGMYEGVNSQGTHPSGDYTGNDGIGGQAVIYVAGKFSLSNLHFCGWNTRTDSAAMTSGTCDFSKWTPSTSMLMIVAHGSPTSVDFSGGQGYFQGAIYSMNDTALGQQVNTDGPFISNTLTIGQGVNMRPLPTILDLPLGAPGNPNTAGVPERPSYAGG